MLNLKLEDKLYKLGCHAAMLKVLNDAGEPLNTGEILFRVNNAPYNVYARNVLYDFKDLGLVREAGKVRGSLRNNQTYCITERGRRELASFLERYKIVGRKLGFVFVDDGD